MCLCRKQRGRERIQTRHCYLLYLERSIFTTICFIFLLYNISDILYMYVSQCDNTYQQSFPRSYKFAYQSMSDFERELTNSENVDHVQVTWVTTTSWTEFRKRHLIQFRSDGVWTWTERTTCSRARARAHTHIHTEFPVGRAKKGCERREGEPWVRDGRDEGRSVSSVLARHEVAERAEHKRARPFSTEASYSRSGDQWVFGSYIQSNQRRRRSRITRSIAKRE